MGDPQPSTSRGTGCRGDRDVWQPWLRSYQCPVCRVEFLSAKALYAHLGEDPQPDVGCLRGIGTKEAFKYQHRLWRKRTHYYTGQTAELKRADSLRRYHQASTARKEEASYSDTLRSYRQSTRYGPIFPCSSCHGAFFRQQVCPLDPPLERQAEHAIDRQFVEGRPHMFEALGQKWLCRSCKKSTSDGELPKLSSRNGLPCSWAEVPQHVGGHPTNFEVELCSPTSIYRQVEGCTLGVSGAEGTTRTWMVPLGRPVGGQSHQTARQPQQAYWLHTHPPTAAPPAANVDRVVAALELLQLSHPAFAASPAEQTQRKTAIRGVIAAEQADI